MRLCDVACLSARPVRNKLLAANNQSLQGNIRQSLKVTQAALAAQIRKGALHQC
jgi:hypothetical protein